MLSLWYFCRSAASTRERPQRVCGGGGAGAEGRCAYTIDQTVLLVAIIGVLVTLVIVSLGWNLLARASGNKLGAYIDQLPHAINAYRSSKGLFPGSQSNTVLVDLDSASLIKFRRDNAWPPNYYHDIGYSDGTVTITAVPLSAQDATDLGIESGQGSYWVSEFRLVPAKESNEVAKTLNGGDFSGRLHILPATASCSVSDMKSESLEKAQDDAIICYIGDRLR